MAEFTEYFNVQEKRNTSDWVDYRNFIQKLRKLLHDPNRVGRPQDRPVLPPQHDPPDRWFDIVLRTNSHAIRLRIRRDNLYLDGFRAEDPDGQWFEFGFPGSTHLIHNESTFLGFDGGYNDLERVAGVPRDDINLGQEQLVNAVNGLATSRSNQDMAHPLIVVIRMICEAIRFEPISSHLATFHNEPERRLSGMRTLENAWGYLSDEVLLGDANATRIFRPLDLGPHIEAIATRQAAGAAIGIVLQPCLRRLGGGRNRRSPDALDDRECPAGRPLVEVFWVRVDNIDGENPGDLYGTITVTDGLGSQIIYNRTGDDYESISPGQNALLTGPARAIFAYDSFTIDVDLKDKDGFLNPDDEVSRGQIAWNVYNTTNSYDEFISRKIDGKYGSVTVNYVVLGNAAEAKVEVTLIDGDEENPANVYGRIVADNGINESVLFRRGKDERIDVRPGQLIPLSRSIIAMPLDDSLKVRAELYDHDAISADDEIANGTAEFPARLSPPSEETISAKYGKIGVKVSWT